jgi:alpha-glucosidase
VHQHFGDRPDQRDELTLVINLDAAGSAEGFLYEDAGEGWAFKDGGFLRTRYTARRNGPWVTVQRRTVDGDMPRPDRTLNVRLLMPDGSEVSATGRDGEAIRITLDG